MFYRIFGVYREVTVEAPHSPCVARYHLVGALTHNEIHTVMLGIRRVAGTYEVELQYDDPGSQAMYGPQRGKAAFDLKELSRLRTPREYGKALAEQLFDNRKIAEEFVAASTAAAVSNGFLRVLLRFEPSVPELQTLRWEQLRHPRTGVFLSTSAHVMLARFVASRSMRRVTPPTRSKLTALIAIAAPSPASLKRYGLAQVDYGGEVQRIREVLAGVAVRTLGGPGCPLTLDSLRDVLDRGVDMTYLVCHGMIGHRGTPTLVLQDGAGDAKLIKVQEMADLVQKSRIRPRLMVLASYDKTVRVWEMGSQRPVLSLEGHQGWISALAVLSDGRVVSSSSDKTVRVWEVNSGRCLATVYGNASFYSVTAVDDHLIVAGDALGDVWFIDLP